MPSFVCEVEGEPTIQMNTPITDENPELPEKIQDLATCAQQKAREAYEAGQKCARENPLAVLAGAVIVGVLIGLLCGSRPPKKKETSQAAKELVDDIVSQISGRIHSIKKPSCCSGDFLKDVGNKIKWW